MKQISSRCADAKEKTLEAQDLEGTRADAASQGTCQNRFPFFFFEKRDEHFF